MYSSIEVQRRAEVVQKCFWPLIELAKSGFKIGIEAPGLTLEIVKSIDNKWLSELKNCIQSGMVELIGSGYSQIIGPLVPAKVNHYNIIEGKKTYQELLGQAPTLWMANEQTYSKGLAECLYDHGITSVVVDWSNSFSSNPSWSEAFEFSPQKTLDSKGRELNVIWSDSLAFQKFQRVIHGEILLEEYIDYLGAIATKMQNQEFPPSFCFYGNDAEIFDFRPGRFKTEPELDHFTEWKRIFSLLEQMRQMNFQFVLPSDNLKHTYSPKTLNLTDAISPCSIKKQPKYNLTRWAVTGRFSSRINQQCFDLALNPKSMLSAKKICELWASDYRTHITQQRWDAMYLELQNLWKSLPASKFTENRSTTAPTETVFPVSKINIHTEHFDATLNPLKGLSIEGINLKGESPFLGRLPHGSFSRIDLSADWFSGNVVLQLPGKGQETDLKKVSCEKSESQDKVSFDCSVPFLNGTILKSIQFDKTQPCWNQRFHFRIPSLPIGSLRFGFLTLNQHELGNDKLTIATHLGGTELEYFEIPDRDFDHGESASSLVSASQGFGMTEGIIKILTSRHILTISLISSTLRPLAMIENKMAREGRFFRLYFTVSEYDETRKEDWDFSDQTIEFHYRLEAL